MVSAEPFSVESAPPSLDACGAVPAARSVGDGEEEPGDAAGFGFGAEANASRFGGFAAFVFVVLGEFWHLIVAVVRFPNGRWQWAFEDLELHCIGEVFARIEDGRGVTSVAQCGGHGVPAKAVEVHAHARVYGFLYARGSCRRHRKLKQSR